MLVPMPVRQAEALWDKGNGMYANPLQTLGFPDGSGVKSPPAVKETQAGSIREWGRFPGGGNGNPLQCSCLEKPTDRGAWWAAVQGARKSRTRLSTAQHWKRTPEQTSCDQK